MYGCPSLASACRLLRFSANSSPKAISKGTPSPTLRPICVPLWSLEFDGTGHCDAVEDGEIDDDEGEARAEVSSSHGRWIRYWFVVFWILKVLLQQFSMP